MKELLTEHESRLVEKLVNNVENKIHIDSADVNKKSDGIVIYTYSEKFLSMYLKKMEIDLAKEMMLNQSPKIEEPKEDKK